MLRDGPLGAVYPGRQHRRVGRRLQRPPGAELQEPWRDRHTVLIAEITMLMPRSKIMKLLGRGAFCVALLATVVAGALPEPSRAQDSLRIAAVVNEDPISELDVYMRLRMAMLTARLEDSQETRDRLLPQVLRNLIDDRLKLQEAKRAGIKVNPADIERRINALAERNKM